MSGVNDVNAEIAEIVHVPSEIGCGRWMIETSSQAYDEAGKEEGYPNARKSSKC